MYCAKCGQQLPDEAAFCSKCGEAIKIDLNKKEKIGGITKKNLIKFLIALTVIVVLIFIAFNLINSPKFIDIQKDSDSIGRYYYRQKWSGPVVTGYTMYFRVMYKGRSGTSNLTVSGDTFSKTIINLGHRDGEKYLIKIYFDEGLWGNNYYKNKDEHPSVVVKLPGLVLSRKMPYGTRSNPEVNVEYLN